MSLSRFDSQISKIFQTLTRRISAPQETSISFGEHRTGSSRSIRQQLHQELTELRAWIEGKLIADEDMRD